MSLSDYGAYVDVRPTGSDLSTTDATVSSNGSTKVTLTTNCKFTSSAGGTINGVLNLYIKGDGSSSTLN